MLLVVDVGTEEDSSAECRLEAGGRTKGKKGASPHCYYGQTFDAQWHLDRLGRHGPAWVA